jgi:hypothetical protein
MTVRTNCVGPQVYWDTALTGSPIAQRVWSRRLAAIAPTSSAKAARPITMPVPPAFITVPIRP